MSYLVYCVLRQRARGHAPPGVAGLPVRMIAEQGLCAAASRMAGAAPEITIANVLAYQHVIEELHDAQSVLPFRYGCVFETIGQVRAALRDRQAQFQRLLEDLDGLVEMGVRFLCEAHVPPAGGSGADYLASRMRQYETTQGVQQALAGLFVRCRKESPQSLHFLVPRTLAPAFSEKARLLRQSAGARMLLSGPWPPYNFVQV